MPTVRLAPYYALYMNYVTESSQQPCLLSIVCHHFLN